jgi:hypothetical protein
LQAEIVFEHDGVPNSTEVILATWRNRDGRRPPRRLCGETAVSTALAIERRSSTDLGAGILLTNFRAHRLACSFRRVRFKRGTGSRIGLLTQEKYNAPEASPNDPSRSRHRHIHQTGLHTMLTRAWFDIDKAVAGVDRLYEAAERVRPFARTLY